MITCICNTDNFAQFNNVINVYFINKLLTLNSSMMSFNVMKTVYYALIIHYN